MLVQLNIFILEFVLQIMQ